MNIFSDRHHAGLTTSLQLLLEQRLGHTLYFQKGMEWYPDFWNLQPFEDTAKQYLERELEGVRGITLEEFKNTKFDVLIASVPQHIEPFKRLIREYQPQAKLVFQIGNAWNIPNNSVRNVMASAKCLPPIQINYVEYHQEFDLNIFKYEPIQPGKKVYSFINCLNVVDLYKKDWALFQELEQLMPDWEFKSFGGQCRDGWTNGPQATADKMKEATFIYMVKSEGDGYGHNIFSAAAMGRPLISRFSDYRGKLAEPLLSPLCTITVDGKSPEQIVEQIEHRYKTIQGDSEVIYQTFKENVDFEADAEKVKEFLDRLL